MSEHQTYTEAQGKQPINWHEFLQTAHINLSENVFERAYDEAFGWVTCAVGNQCAIIPRDEYGEPEDGTLSFLGTGFSAEIAAMLFHHKANHLDHFEASRRAAIDTLQKIEARSAFLIAEIQNQHAHE